MFRGRGRRAHGAVLTLAVLAASAAGPTSDASGSVPSARVRIGKLPRLSPSAKVIGALAASTPMHVTLALKPPDPNALAAYARAVSTPGSSAYREYLTTAQFARRFGATAGELAAVTRSLAAHELPPPSVSANHLSLEITASAAQVQRAFSLTLRRMALANGKRAVVASASPALDRQVAGDVQAVIGLSTLSAPRPQMLRPGLVRPSAARRLAASSAPRVATGGPQACSAASSAASSQGAHTADQIASAYRFSALYGAGAEGQGVTVALYELEPNDPADIAGYQACYGTNAPVSYIQVDGGAGTGPGAGEAALDIENAIGLAPQANFLVYQAPNSNQDSPGSGPYDLFRQIISDDRAQVISVSWGSCEPLQGASNVRAESTLFQEAAIQGQSIISATGDQGSEDCNGGNGLPDPSLAVDDPGSQQFITGVGGTTLGALGPPPAESVWNNGGNTTGMLGTQGGAGGGGLSQIWPMPSYQSGAPASLHVIGAHSSGSSCGNVGGFCRQVPDVAADADPSTGYIVYWNGSGAAGPLQPSGWQAIGGTSAAAPVWAALLADADSSSSCGGSRIGFANPALYQAAGSSYGSYFNDVTSGNNDFTATNGGLYGAGPAYDMASGLGSPKAAALAVGLCSDALQVKNPGTQVSTVGQPVSFQVATNAPAGARLSFAASKLPSGLSVSKLTGRISGKPRRIGSSSVTVSATDQGLALRSAAFTWKVVGAPTVSQLSLTGVGAGHPRLALTITAGNGAPQLTSATIGLPRGLSFGRIVGNAKVTGANGRRVSFSARLVGGRLQLVLAKPAQRIRLTVSGSGIKAAGGLVANARRGRAARVTLTLTTTDAGRHIVGINARTTPRG